MVGAQPAQEVPMRPRTIAVPTLLLAYLLVVAGPPTVGAGPIAATGPLTQVSDVSPFVGDCGLAGQTGTNYRHSEVEPWIEVNPTDPDSIAGIWQQDRWSNGGARGLVAGVSTDGGATWQSVVIPGLSHCSGGIFERATDPWLSFAPNGELYSMSLSFDNTTSANALLVNESDDGGLTWSPPTAIVDGSDGFGFNDKNSLTADPNDPNYVYATWQRVGQTWFTRSTTAATTDPALWEPARAIHVPSGGQRTIGHQIVVLPESDGGDLVNGFTLFGKGNKRYIAVLRSEDHGATWTGPITVSTQDTVGIADPETSHNVRTGNFLPDFAVDPTGAVYAVWQDARFDPASGKGKGGRRRHDSIAFSKSTNGGLTWTPPIKVNQTPTDISSGNQQAFTASVDVSNDGTVSVTYYDFRNNTSDAGTLLTDYWAVHCHSSTSSCATDPGGWSESRVTDAPFDMSEAPDASGWFVGDYEGLDSEGGSYLPFFSQTHPGDPATIFFRRVGP
jgi:hypothetical protein